MTLQEIEKEALKLPEPFRASLARNLLLSLQEGDEDPEHDQIWAEEATRRLHDLRENPAAAVPIEEAVRKLQARAR
jgi:putative addiction module component (TIGR02574 family)